jgi:hypothetical protein
VPVLVLPIKSITPGAFNAKVRQATIERTICKAGWSAKVRPPVSYTNALKIKQMPIYELGGSPSLSKEGHLIAQFDPFAAELLAGDRINVKSVD